MYMYSTVLTISRISRFAHIGLIRTNISDVNSLNNGERAVQYIKYIYYELMTVDLMFFLLFKRLLQNADSQSIYNHMKHCINTTSKILV